MIELEKHFSKKELELLSRVIILLTYTLSPFSCSGACGNEKSFSGYKASVENKNVHGETLYISDSEKQLLDKFIEKLGGTND